MSLEAEVKRLLNLKPGVSASKHFHDLAGSLSKDLPGGLKDDITIPTISAVINVLTLESYDNLYRRCVSHI